MAIVREDFDWGVRLTASPLPGANAALEIRSEVSAYVPDRGTKVKITFSGTSMMKPLGLMDAQAWNEGLSAIINETRSVSAELKASVKDGPKKK